MRNRAWGDPEPCGPREVPPSPASGSGGGNRLPGLPPSPGRNGQLQRSRRWVSCSSACWWPRSQISRSVALRLRPSSAMPPPGAELVQRSAVAAAAHERCDRIAQGSRLVGARPPSADWRGSWLSPVAAPASPVSAAVVVAWWWRGIGAEGLLAVSLPRLAHQLRDRLWSLERERDGGADDHHDAPVVDAVRLPDRHGAQQSNACRSGDASEGRNRS